MINDFQVFDSELADSFELVFIYLAWVSRLILYYRTDWCNIKLLININVIIFVHYQTFTTTNEM